MKMLRALPPPHILLFRLPLPLIRIAQVFIVSLALAIVTKNLIGLADFHKYICFAAFVRVVLQRQLLIRLRC
jgi:hypothetical protein